MLSQPIRRVVVLGSGMMGGGIAAHIANAGIPVALLDIVPSALTPEEESRGLTLESPAVRNRIVLQGLDRVKKSNPAALYADSVLDLIQTGNFEDHWHLVGEADWIIEAVVENLAIKRTLMTRVDETRKPDSIVSSNTSGIPIGQIGRELSASFNAHFLGTHFFNPPRYLHLLEVIPTPATQPDVVRHVSDFVANFLGKGVVMAKDTPNFIANRIGVFVGQYRVHYAIEHGYTVEEVDELTGPLIGNPRTATFRLADLVGIDVWAHVSQNLAEAGVADEMQAYFRTPAPMAEMIQRGWLGNKSKQGFYKQVKDAHGKREFWSLNLQTLDYEAPVKPRFGIVSKTRKIEDIGERLRQIFAAADDDRAARFITDSILSMLAYASQRLPEIADSVVDVDRAMRWGFNQEYGPFEMWDRIGVAEATKLAESRGHNVADWVKAMLASGQTSFYQTALQQAQDVDQGAPVAAYAPAAAAVLPLVFDKRAINLNGLRSANHELARNESASLIDLGDGVLLLEFHAKMNTLDAMIFELGEKALNLLEKPEWNGLVIGNQGENFSAGANVGIFSMAITMGYWEQLEQLAQQFQNFVMDMRYAPKPVVVAPHGLTLGGGAEVSMHSAMMTADAETYIGLVELGVGIVPAGGGCKEMLRRVISPPMKTPHVDPLPFLRAVFETVAMANVARSAVQGREYGFLGPHDRIVMNSDFRLGEARRAVLELVEQGYVPPAREATKVYAIGQRGLGALAAAVYGFREGGFISEYDAYLANKLAYVLCGGNLTQPAWVPEQYILDLEREAFMSLVSEPKTQARVEHLLQTGKPLRN